MRKIISVIVILILGFASFSLAKGSYDSYKKLQEVNNNQGNLNDLKLKNTKLKEELKQKQSDFALEKEARDKLGFGKAGETTIVIPDSNIAAKANSQGKEQKSNLQQWLDLLKITL